MIRVVLVDDQELVRTGLQRILRRQDGFEVVAECTDGSEVAAAVARVKPDVVVMDLRMKGVDGIEATRRLREGDDAPPVLVLTTFDDDELLSGALRAGANGFQLKDAPAEDLIRAVTEGSSQAPPPSLAELTPRETEVLRLMGRGLNNGEIAEELFISEVTVKTHVGNIFMKLGVRDRAAAIVFAFDHAVVVPGEDLV